MVAQIRPCHKHSIGSSLSICQGCAEFRCCFSDLVNKIGNAYSLSHTLLLHNADCSNLFHPGCVIISYDNRIRRCLIKTAGKEATQTYLSKGSNPSPSAAAAPTSRSSSAVWAAVPTCYLHLFIVFSCLFFLFLWHFKPLEIMTEPILLQHTH